jgi:hypothetical protein
MHIILPEVRRVLTPTGSAVFVLQTNGERLGKMRPWLWDFLSWAAREWNVVQDAYWWNPTAIPQAHAAHGLLRPSVKTCVWLGPPDCYRNQDAVLWTESQATTAHRAAVRAGRDTAKRTQHRSGFGCNPQVAYDRAEVRGGATPFNLLPISNTDSLRGASAFGHGAGTPLALCAWWVRYLTPPGGLVLDPFAGVGSTAVAARQEGCRAVLIERHEPYCRATVERLRRVQPALGPFEEAAG